MSPDWHLGYFQFFYVINEVIIIILPQIFLCTSVVISLENNFSPNLLRFPTYAKLTSRKMAHGTVC